MHGCNIISVHGDIYNVNQICEQEKHGYNIISVHGDIYNVNQICEQEIQGYSIISVHGDSYNVNQICCYSREQILFVIIVVIRRYVNDDRMLCKDAFFSDNETSVGCTCLPM
jgi:hypothetical protein